MNSNNKKSNGLMGDLESIKALLEEDDLESVPEALSQALNPAEFVTDPDAGEHAGDNAYNVGDHDIELDDEIPLLADTLSSFDPKTGLSTPLTAEPAPVEPILEDTPEPEGLSNVTLDALLGDEFHEATAQVMQQARGLINQHATEWSPQQTDELADALRVRIDDAVQQWIQTSLAAHAGELQQRLLNAVRKELAHHLDALESTPG